MINFLWRIIWLIRRNTFQRQRWVATALLEIEPNLRKIKGYKHLPLLRGAMERDDEKQILADVA